MSYRKPYEVLEVMEGSTSPQAVSMADFCCEKHALQACERAWGVRLQVAVTLSDKRLAWNGLEVLVTCVHSIHAGELNDWPGVKLELLDPEVISYGLQIVSALYVAACSIEQHMKR